MQLHLKRTIMYNPKHWHYSLEPQMSMYNSWTFTTLASNNFSSLFGEIPILQKIQKTFKSFRKKIKKKKKKEIKIFYEITMIIKLRYPQDMWKLKDQYGFSNYFARRSITCSVYLWNIINHVCFHENCYIIKVLYRTAIKWVRNTEVSIIVIYQSLELVDHSG